MHHHKTLMALTDKSPKWKEISSDEGVSSRSIGWKKIQAKKKIYKNSQKPFFNGKLFKICQGLMYVLMMTLSYYHTKNFD